MNVPGGDPPASGSTSSSRWPRRSTVPTPPLEWERHSYIGCDAEASQQVLWDYARRYWLCDKLMLLDAAHVRGVHTGAENRAVVERQKAAQVVG